MSEAISKYLHQEMDRQAGIEHTFHRTKIVATIGPSCDTYEKMLELARAGVNVFRLNFSHGKNEDKARILGLIDRMNKEEPFNVASLADLQGPKLRVGEIQNGLLEISNGDILTFTSKEKVIGTKEKIYVSYPNLHLDVKVGDKILIDDGKLEVVVIEITPNEDVKVAVTYGGILLPKKGVNLPDTEISLPALTEKDLADLEFILQHKVDWIALSFVRKAEDIIDLKARIAEKNSTSKVIAKIEMPSALRDLRNIILESDAVMVARGDLGVELPVEKKVAKRGNYEAKSTCVSSAEAVDSLLRRARNASRSKPRSKAIGRSRKAETEGR